MTAVAPPRDATTTQTLRWMFDRLNEQDLASLRPFWTDETIEYFPNRTCHGVEEVVDYFNTVFAAVQGMRIEVLAIAEAGEDAFVHWRLTGTHVGRFVGVDGTGRSVVIDGIDHFVIRDEKIVSNTVVFDQMQFARQIKLLPADGTRTDRTVKGAFNTLTKAIAMARRRR